MEPGKVLLVSVAPKIEESPDRSGMRTPPFHTTAAVPFRWEEEPGKPRPCSALAIVPSSGPGEPYSATGKCLELPPRLLSEAIIAKMPSPQQTSSFRMGGECYGSFRSYVVAERVGYGDDEEGSDVGATREGVLARSKPSGWWWWSGGSSGKRKKRETGGGGGGGGSSYVFPSFSCNYVVDRESSEWRRECRNSTNMRRPGSFPLLSYSSHSHSHFSWATLYGGLKEVIPWRRSRKAWKMRS